MQNGDKPTYAASAWSRRLLTVKELIKVLDHSVALSDIRASCQAFMDTDNTHEVG
jgi:hypothetical protein